MDLLDAIRKDVLKQKEEEVVNFFTRVDDFRAFITATEPAPDVNVSVKMCYLSSERLNGDNGTRVTVIDASQHGVFEATNEGLLELSSSKRKPYIAQITVWDAKTKRGVTSKPNILFRTGGLYEFRQVDGVGFYANIPSGRLQYDRSAKDKIVEVLAPLAKRKAATESPKKNGKAKLRAFSSLPRSLATHDLETEEDDDDDSIDFTGNDVSMQAEAKSEDDGVACRTRSNAALAA